jgi:hypothetical protein
MLNHKFNQASNNKLDSCNISYTYYENYPSYQEAITLRREAILESMENQEQVESKVKIVKLLEMEFEDLEKQQNALVYSNEEMFKCDPNDLELIECRAENMKYIKLNFERMKQIYEEISKLDRNNKLLGKSIFSLNYDFEKNDEEPKNIHNNHNASQLIKNNLDGSILKNNSVNENEKTEKVVTELEI